VEEEKQDQVDALRHLMGWATGLAQVMRPMNVLSKSTTPGDVRQNLAEQQAITDELATKKEQVSEAIKAAQIFLAKHGEKLSAQEKEDIQSQLTSLEDTYNQLRSDSAVQLQQLQGQLVREAEQKRIQTIAGVIDLGTMEIFPIFRAMQKGLLDHDTGLVLLEAQLAVSGLVIPEDEVTLTLEQALSQKVIDHRTFQHLQELRHAIGLLDELSSQNQLLLPAVRAIQEQRIRESVVLDILEYHLAAGGLKIPSHSNRLSLEEAFQQGHITARLCSSLEARQKGSKNLIDPNTAQKVSLKDLIQQCVTHQESGQRLLPVKQLGGGIVCLRSGRKVSIFRAVQEGLIDRQVTVRLLEAQLFAGGIVDPRGGHRLTVDEALHHHLIDHDLACAILSHQLQGGGIVDPFTGQRLTLDEAIQKDLVAPEVALMMLEFLCSFSGLLWPESGEILAVLDALQQDVLSPELSHKILNARHSVQGLYLAETAEVISWQTAVESGILERDVAKKLESMVFPDVMPNLNSADSQALISGGLGLQRFEVVSRTEHSERHVAGEAEWLIAHLGRHSYINIHSGQRVLLDHVELNEVVQTFTQTYQNGSVSDHVDFSRDHLSCLDELKAKKQDCVQCPDSLHLPAHLAQQCEQGLPLKEEHGGKHSKNDANIPTFKPMQINGSSWLDGEKILNHGCDKSLTRLGENIENTKNALSPLQSRRPTASLTEADELHPVLQDDLFKMKPENVVNQLLENSMDPDAQVSEALCSKDSLYAVQAEVVEIGVGGVKQLYEKVLKMSENLSNSSKRCENQSIVDLEVTVADFGTCMKSGVEKEIVKGKDQDSRMKEEVQMSKEDQRMKDKFTPEESTLKVRKKDLKMKDGDQECRIKAEAKESKRDQQSKIKARVKESRVRMADESRVKEVNQESSLNEGGQQTELPERE
ncbi:hypothetical protein NDU88_003220, partial [Pleurodeles waltl]